MKGGIVHSTAFNTVSENYAEEIKYPFYGEGLDGVIREYQNKLTGIVNGIDYEIWNPKTDKNIYKNYDLKSIKIKRKIRLSSKKNTAYL